MVKNGRARKVICLTTMEVFECLKSGAEKYNTRNSEMTQCCKGKQKSSGKLADGTKLQWMYYEDYIKQQKLVQAS